MLKPSRRLRISILIFALACTGIFYWFKTPPPLIGGGKPDSFLAGWVKSRVYASIPVQEDSEAIRLTPANGNGWYNLTREPIQCFDYYRSSNPTRPTPTRRVIVLQPLGKFDSAQLKVLNDLREFIAAFFQLPVRVEKPMALSPDSVSTRPSAIKPTGVQGVQFNANEILGRVLESKLPPDAVAYLGITMSDLWSDDLSFVFGLGSADSRVGVYSLSRYFPLPGKTMSEAQKQRGLRRSCQILDHEMGHMLGLYHCVLYKCAMNGCNGLGDADEAPLDYCPVCLRKLLWNVGSDKHRRAVALARFYHEHGLQRELNLTLKRFTALKSK